MNFIYYQALQLAGCYCISFSNIFLKNQMLLQQQHEALK